MGPGQRLQLDVLHHVSEIAEVLQVLNVASILDGDIYVSTDVGRTWEGSCSFKVGLPGRQTLPPSRIRSV